MRLDPFLDSFGFDDGDKLTLVNICMTSEFMQWIISGVLSGLLPKIHPDDASLVANILVPCTTKAGIGYPIKPGGKRVIGTKAAVS